MRKKRVWCLYRVSGKKQVSVDDDIPMQKNACKNFVNTKPDWEITNELYEKGVSGWSIKAEHRDEMNIIKDGAIKGKFDVLLVFMNDRIGRREDETPFVVQFLIEQGIEVWSVQEGQTKIEEHVDILTNFINYWQSAGESKKTSRRTREAKKQLSEQGHFQGGNAPLGYKIVETNEVHWKNKDRMLKELVVDEDEAELVKFIFNSYVDKHMGYRKIVDYLNTNGYRSKLGNLFSISAIQRIIKNPIYIGKKKYAGFSGEKGDTQPYNEKLRIISDEQFNMALQISATRNDKSKIQDKNGIPLAGKLMFSGLAFCMFCESKLSASYRYRKHTYKNERTVVKPSYRYFCQTPKGEAVGNHLQSFWGAIKYDEIIINKIKEAILKVDVSSYIETAVKQKKKQISQKEKNVKILDKEIDGYKKQLDKLNSEIAKSLMGESDFTPEQLSSAIAGTNKLLQEKAETLDNLLKEIVNEKENYSDVNYVANELDNWENKFDKADNDLKKAMLSRVVDKVYIGKNKVKIKFNLALEECFKTYEEL